MSQKEFPWIVDAVEFGMIEPGDILVDHTRGARMVTHVSWNIEGKTAIHFGMPDVNGDFDITPENTLYFDRFFSRAKVSIVIKKGFPK
jgi:hypothetical protein